MFSTSVLAMSSTLSSQMDSILMSSALDSEETDSSIPVNKRGGREEAYNDSWVYSLISPVDGKVFLKMNEKWLSGEEED